MLSVTGLRRRFGDVAALDGVGLTVAPGEVRGFVGRNGAGKTTAMRIIMGVERADEGTVTWDGVPLDAPLRTRFGYMPEERGLYPKMSARRQLAYFARLRGTPRQHAWDAADRWLSELGLATRADENVENLSMGNQQRVQLAVALAHEPEVLVLDEPFMGLDPVGTDQMSEVLRRRASQGAAVLFSSHQLELVERLCHTVTIIDDGRVVADGSVMELRRGGAVPAYRIRIDQAHGTWARELDGVRVIDAGGDEHTDGVLVEPAAADAAEIDRLLTQARSIGTVLHFAEELPTLADRYRDAVIDDADGRAQP